MEECARLRVRWSWAADTCGVPRMVLYGRHYYSVDVHEDPEFARKWVRLCFSDRGLSTRFVPRDPLDT